MAANVNNNEAVKRAQNQDGMPNTYESADPKEQEAQGKELKQNKKAG